jgi:hypothetical protein
MGASSSRPRTFLKVYDGMHDCDSSRHRVVWRLIELMKSVARDSTRLLMRSARGHHIYI